MLSDNIKTALIFAFVLLSFYCGNRYLKYFRIAKLRDLVAWCATKDSGIFRCNLPLWAYIKNAQLHFNLQPQYAISGDAEWDHVNTILCGFTDHLVQAFLCGNLHYRRFMNLRFLTNTHGSLGEHFFMFELFSYLYDHCCDSSFLGNDMHKKTISFDNHGMWGKHLYDATYELTDFAIVLHKLYYIAFLFCKESNVYKNDFATWLTSNHFTDILDSKQIVISSM